MKKHLFSFIFLVLLLAGCTGNEPELLLISKDSTGNIRRWMHQLDTTLVIREVYPLPNDSLEWYLQRATGIIIGGGGDVSPSMYDKPEYRKVCHGMDPYRDSLESVLIRHAQANGVPLLGICRGHQIINVVHGGTLIPDIPSFMEEVVNHNQRKERAHAVTVKAGSFLHSLVGRDTLFVNSSHHQCAERVAPGFTVAARSRDGVIESLERVNGRSGPFLLGVQWHPERLPDPSSEKIGAAFIQAMEEY